VQSTRFAIKEFVLILPALLLACCNVGRAAETSVADTRATLAKWVETRQMIFRLKADWDEDRETIKSTISLFKVQQERLAEKLAQVGEQNGQVAKETTEHETQLKKCMAALDKVEEMVVGFESKLKAQIPNYPPPLVSQELVSKIISLIPEDSRETKVPLISRVQNLILILKAVQEFNSELLVASEIRRNGDKEIEVQAIYLGLGQAWFVSKDGSFAGTGGPSENGWIWQPDPSIAGQVQDAIAVYDKSKPASYVALKAVVK